jgi:hypothetical protein
MLFMIMVKATPESDAGEMPDEELLDAMQRFHEELYEAGMLMEATGLQTSAAGWRIRYDGERQEFIEGPFDAPHRVLAGYTIIRADNREQALEWTRRFPNPASGKGRGEIEVRRLMEVQDELPSDAPALFRQMDVDFR